MEFCSECGQGNRDDSAFCIQCGTPLKQQPPGEQPGTTPESGQTPESAGQAPQPQGEPMPQPPGPQGAEPAGPPPAGPPPQAPMQPFTPGAQAPPGYAPPPMMRVVPTDGLAIASLVLSISSFIFCPFFAAILGLVFGYISLNHIAEQKGALGGEPLARAGIIIGWVHLGLVILAGILLLILVVVGVVKTS